MKNSIKSLAILLVFLTASVFGQNPVPTEPNPARDRITVIFNHTLHFNELVRIKLDMGEKGITLAFKKLEFDENGGLLSIDFNVNCNDGYKGSAQESNLTDESKFGFYRDYSKNAKSSFGTGYPKKGK